MALNTKETQRLAQLRDMLAARTKDEKPLKGYAHNVTALRAEIAALERRNDPVDTDPPPA